MTKILDDFTVIDFTHVIAGAHCTKMLAEFGIEVIKIEPLGGEMVRLFPTQRDGRSAHFVQHNVGKKNHGSGYFFPKRPGYLP